MLWCGKDMHYIKYCFVSVTPNGTGCPASRQVDVKGLEVEYGENVKLSFMVEEIGPKDLQERLRIYFRQGRHRGGSGVGVAGKGLIGKDYKRRRPPPLLSLLAAICILPASLAPPPPSGCRRIRRIRLISSAGTAESAESRLPPPPTL